MDIQVKINEIKHKLKTDDEAFDKQPYQIINNREIALAIIDFHPDSFACLNNQLHDDDEMVALAVSRHGYNLRYASVRLKNDRNIVTLAINQKAQSLESASYELKNDMHIVLLALKNFSAPRWILQFAGDKIREEIGNNDPIYYIERVLLKEKIENTVNATTILSNKNASKIKI